MPYQPQPGGRNLRSVWNITTAPYRGAHFATYPPALVRRIVAAATPVRCCGLCGAPWAPVIERGAPDLEHQRACGGDANGLYDGQALKDYARKRVTGHRPTCSCADTEGVPAVVLDPFAGSGTTGAVALELGRRAVLIELNPEYAKLAEARTNITPGMPL